MPEPYERKTLSVSKAAETVGVSRRTLYNWMDEGKVEYTYTAGGSRRIFADTLYRDTPPCPTRTPTAPALRPSA